MKYTNETGIPELLALWLQDSEYQYVVDKKYISATTLTHSVRQIVLSERARETNQLPRTDVLSLVQAKMGTAIHKSIEDFLRDYFRHDPEASHQPVIALEGRTSRVVEGWTVSGQYDLVADGVLHDFKSRKTYSWNKDMTDVRVQGSIYRWLNPELITSGVMEVDYIFKDWSQGKVTTDDSYPNSPIKSKKVVLMSLDETERYIRNKLRAIDKYRTKEEREIPECTESELWTPSPVYKYYKDSLKTKRSTKNFNSAIEAEAYLNSQGIGVVKEVTGTPLRCKHCAAYVICEQRKKYYND